MGKAPKDIIRIMAAECDVPGLLATVDALQARLAAAEGEATKWYEAYRDLAMSVTGSRTIISCMNELNAKSVTFATEYADKQRARLDAAEDLLAGLLDGLNANGDGRDGLSSEEWDERVSKARAHLAPAPTKPEGGEVARG